jgi:peptidyl-prolyl cis-trans isomerase C
MVNIRLEQIKSSSRGRNLDEAYIDSMRERLNKGALEAAIIETLIDQKMKEHNISVSEMQIEEYITQLAAREGMTIDDLKSLVTSGGKTFEQWKEQMQFDKIIGVLKIAQLEGFGSMDVNDNDVQKFYEENKARYETPEQVKASHILIKPDTSAGADPNTADAEARAKAEDLLKQIKEDADFAQLAQGNSACPSSARGGDLGFGQRRTWVGPFADAAFALQPGQISDVVKTRFGSHIIKVTERKEAGITSFDEAKDQIKKMLQARREAEVSSNFVKTIRKNADVVYAEGIQPYESEQPVQ